MGPPPGNGCLGVNGVGTQFDPSFPYTEGYQVLALEYFPLPGFEFLDEDAIQMNPNPAQDLVWFSGELQIDRLDVFSLDGKKVKTNFLYAREGALSVDDLSAGIYVVRAITSEGTWTSKVVVER
jgi:hypothetical protein